MQHVSFTRMDEVAAEDYAFLNAVEDEFVMALPDRLLAAFYNYSGHAWFDSCEQFCLDWDRMAFDPDCLTKPLAHFEPMLRKIFTCPPFVPAIINPAG